MVHPLVLQKGEDTSPLPEFIRSHKNRGAAMDIM
jgi:hypothetical protein